MLDYKIYKETYCNIISTNFNDFLRYPFDGVEQSVEDMLMKWASNKEWIYKLFGNSNFYESNTFAIDADKDDIVHYKNEFLSSSYGYINDRTKYREFSNFAYSNAIDADGFKDNSVKMDKTLFETEEQDKQIKITRGTKFSKTFRYFAEDESLTKLQTLYSIYAQKMHSKKKGTIYLSIHPYDYLTISDNTKDWSSCHNTYDGDYRAGNLNYLADSATIVAYYLLEDDNWDNSLLECNDDFLWNSKAWRMLIHLRQEEDKIAIVYNKQYPYTSEQLFNITDELIQKLFKDYETIFIEESEGRNYYYIDDYIGYCDLNVNKYPSARYSKKLTPDKSGNLSEHFFIKIGEPVFCLNCGEEDATDSHSCTCRKCCNEYNASCDECGETGRIDDFIYIESEDIYVCQYCYDRYFTVCADCGEYIRTDEVFESEIGWICQDCYNSGSYIICDECGIAIYCGNEHIVEDSETGETTICCDYCYRNRN